MNTAPEKAATLPDSNSQPPASYMRDFILFGILAIIIAFVFTSQGSIYSVRMMAEAGCYAVLALGLTIQWGYAGMFNIGIMGFVAAGAAASMLVAFPRNEAFWNSDGASMLGFALLVLLIGVGIIWLANRSHRIGAGPKLKALLIAISLAGTYIAVTSAIEPAADLIEKEAGWMGGLGLPVVFGWIAAGIVAGLIAWFVGKICLGLRTDYLAIATLGIAQIIKTFVKNADWLTNGTLTVSPLPWPTPGIAEMTEYAGSPDLGVLYARSIYLCLTAIVIVIIYLLLQRAYHAPWGRMMRSIRDNEDAAEAMGKDVNRRRLEIFIFGCVIMGLGGAMLTTFVGLFDPSGFIDLNHTFLVWVMVILGGSGNNRGAILGAIFVYILWTMSEPMALSLFHAIREVGLSWFGWVAPDDLDSRALQMRVFVIGLTITLVVRFMPEGFLPERVSDRGNQ